MSLIAELKRRNVFRVGIAYVVTAWLVSQVAELAADSFEAPAWVMKMFITLLVLFFPFALIFAWAYELTPEGIKKEKDIDRSSSMTQTTGRKLDFAIIAILVITLGYFVYDKFVKTPSARTVANGDSAQPVQIDSSSDGADVSQNETLATDNSGPPSESTIAAGDKSIAILPFTNRSAGAEDTRFLSDGIHDDLLTNLSKIHELKVISRTSVMAYRDTTKNIRDIGKELGVANLLEGAVQQAGERVRINVQLINAESDKQLWAESYDREVSAENIFEIQAEIARAIAHALEATLSPEENEGLGSTPTANFEAYQAVLVSRQLANRGSFDSLARAADYARQAIELDSEYADAHLALAFALVQGIFTGTATDQQLGAEISTAIDSALLLEPEYDQAWSMLGHYQASIGHPDAAASFERAMQLNPGNAQTLYFYGDMLQRSGRPLKALPLLQRASELDPLSLSVLLTLGRTHDALENYDKGSEVIARIREIDPASPLGYAPASGPYYSRGQIDMALYWLGRGQSTDPKDFELAGWIVFFNDCLEDHEAAGAWSAWLESWVTNQPQPMAMQARHHYLMGNFDTALQYSNMALRLGLPDRWGSDAIFMRIKRDEALANGEPDDGIGVFRSYHPELFADPPEINADNLQQAVDLALLHKLAGRQKDALRVLQASIEFYDRPWAVSGSVRATLVPAKAEALALLDREADALSELRRIIDKGWRVNWRWETELNFNFNGIRDTAEFKTMTGELRADMAVQRTNVQAMVANGEINPPPQSGQK